jgi:hypothetical protein
MFCSQSWQEHPWLLQCTFVHFNRRGHSVPHFISFRVGREEQVAGLVPEAIRCLNDAVTERHQPINIHLWSLGH